MDTADGSGSEIFRPDLASNTIHIHNSGEFGDDTILILSGDKTYLGMKSGKYDEEETMEAAKKVFEW